MNKPTLQQFTAWARMNRELAQTVIKARVYATMKRDQVDAYIAPIFEKFSFYPSADMLKLGVPNERITDINLLYMTDLESAPYKTFCQHCDAAHTAHGFDGDAGYCPALIARDLQAQAENALLDSGCALLGMKHPPYRLDDRAQMLDMLIGACVAGCEKLAA